LHASWDETELALEPSPGNPRNMLVTLPEPWTVSARHTLHLWTEFSPAQQGESALSFSSEAFFLPAAGWNAELFPPEGLFASGGIPPKTWNFLVAVPEGFRIHTSGVQKKSSKKNGERIVVAEQTAKDPYPFVIAGRYKTADIGKGKVKVRLWTSRSQEAAQLDEASDALARVIAAYDTAFGERNQESSQIWIVACPVVAGCFTSLNPLRAGALLGQQENQRATAEMISEDTVVVDLSGGAPALAATAAPSLASSWLGYAQNPAYFEQRPPLTMLSVFAAAIGRDAAEGADSRSETIRRALRLIPVNAMPRNERKEEAANVLHAKSFLFFYALQDRYGREAFRKATHHMLYARQGKGFELDDLIAAFEQETHQNVAEFVRMWMKRPGVPEEFRARYEGSAAATASNKETTTP